MRLIDGDALVDAMTGACNIFDAHGADTTLARTLITIADKVPPIGGWISVKDGMPESGQHVLATCELHSLFGYKKQYVCEAYYAKEHSISEGRYPEDTDCYDYSEEDDEYYLKEGWYEVIHNWDEYGSVVIGDFVTHWMPLPEPPKEAQQCTSTATDAARG